MRIVLFLAFFMSTLLFADKALYFEGNKVVSDSEISSVLNLQNPPLYYFWDWFAPYEIEESRVDNIVPILRRYYRSLGYFSVKISLQKKEKKVVVSIVEGERARIKTIHADSVAKPLMLMHAKEYFDPELFVESKKRILRHFLENGYCHVALNAKAYIDKVKEEAELYYYVDEGDICHVSNIEVEGIDKAKAKVILEHIELKKNQKFDIKNIERSYRLIQSYGAFSKVSITYDKRDRKKTDLDIKIKLSDNLHPRILKVGLGYTSDVGARLFASWQNQDLLHEMKVLRFAFNLSQIEQEVSAGFITRSFIPIGKEWLNTLDYNQYISFHRKKFAKFHSDSFLIKPALEKIEYVRALQFGLLINKTLITEETNKVSLTSLGEDSSAYFYISPFFKLDYDYRDSKMSPTKGFLWQNYIEYSNRSFTSISTYLKVVERISKVLSFHRLRVALSAKVGIINEYERALPPSKYFYGGGSYSNRAYSYERLQTADTQSLLGAKSLLDTSINIIHPIYKKFDGFIFSDGTILNEAELSFDSPMVMGYGAGASYNTDVGPINMSVGFDPNIPGQYALHFQVGYTF